MKSIFIQLVLILMIFGCSDNVEIRTPASDLSGTWNWVGTDGGIGFNIHETPETTGNSVKLVLNDNFDYQVFVNNSMVASGKYELTKEESIYSSERENYIKLDGDFQLQYVVLNGIVRVEEKNSLTISDNFYDGVGSRFKLEE